MIPKGNTEASVAATERAVFINTDDIPSLENLAEYYLLGKPDPGKRAIFLRMIEVAKAREAAKQREGE